MAWKVFRSAPTIDTVTGRVGNSLCPRIKRHNGASLIVLTCWFAAAVSESAR